jgi:diaminopimelate decarboxylase
MAPRIIRSEDNRKEGRRIVDFKSGLVTYLSAPMLLGTQTVNSRGHLEIGGCDTRKLADEFSTPLYIMDEAFIRSNCRSYVNAFATRYPATEISYAGKAFLTVTMARLVDEEGLGLDVASAGELFTAIKANFPADRILLHGNNKSRDELLLALDYGVGRIVVDNFFELRALATLCNERRQKQKILLRVAPGVDPHTHRLIRTGQEDTKFGFNIKNGDALAAIQEALEAAPAIELVGLHCHIGSQLLDAKTHADAIEAMVRYIRSVRDETGWACRQLDIGGGLGIKYLRTHNPPSYDEFAELVIGALQSSIEKYQIEPPVFLQEPGRSIVGEAGTTLYTIGAIKTVPIPNAPGTRVYVAVDGGMSDNPRPQLYEAVYECLVANKMGEEADKVVTIAGKHCETDILIWDTKIGDAEPGDLLAVQSTGAYNYSMASNYNRLPRPACVFVADGRTRLVSRRESLEDLVRLDVLPEPTVQ